MTAHSVASVQEWWRPVARVSAQVGADAERSQRSALAFWALMYFLFSLLVAPQSFVPGLGSLHLAAIAVAVACTAHLAQAWRAGQSALPQHRSLLWAFSLGGWALLTAPFSYWPGGSVELLFGLYFKSLVIFWLLGALVDSPLRLRQLVTWLTLLTLPIGATAIWHFATGAYVPGGDRSAPRIMGYDAPLTANPNDLALVLSMMLPLAVALAAAHQRWFARWAFASIAALDVVAVVITYSRTGFVTLGTLAAVGLLKFARGPWLLFFPVTVAVGLLMLPLLPDNYLQHMATITAIDTDPTGSAQTRWSDTLTAAKLVLASPIVGAGAGMSTLALNAARGPTWVPVHNVYLEYATDLGLPGMTLFLALLGSCFFTAARIVRDSATPSVAWDFRCIARGVEMTIIAFAVAGFFHPIAYHFHFYYAAGLAVALAVVWEKQHG